MFWLVVGGIAAWYVFGRHDGDLDSAWQEIVDTIQELYSQNLQATFEEVKKYLVAHKAIIIILLVLIVALAVVFWPQGPEPVQLTAGQNIIEDLCGNQVKVWVVITGTNEDRIEVTLDMVRRQETLTILAPGAPVKCLREIPLTYSE